MNPVPDLPALVAALAEALSARGERLATAESCTGGLIAAALTDRAGSSAWFERGVVSYANAAKQSLLGVPAALIEREGAVSQACAEAMVSGLLAQAPVHWAVAVTGIAGPGGGSPTKPVGTVWIAWQRQGAPAQSQCHRFAGDRAAVRRQSVEQALRGLLDRVHGSG